MSCGIFDGKGVIIPSMILIILGTLLILIFIAPMVTMSVVNIGNIGGAALGAALILLGIYWKHLPEKWRHIILAAGAVLVLLVVIETIFMVTAAHREPAEDATVIVLGCKVKPYGPSLSLQERIDAAYEYMTAHPDAVCIASGGQGRDEPMSEGECIRQQLIKKGIADERIYVEDRSTSTIENIRYSHEIVLEHGLSENIAIVTNNYHIYRAMQTAKSCGLEAGAVPAETLWILLPTYYVRELGGILATWIVG